MILKQLEIQGFKSFPDKVKITFDKGVTAVVGPNGSGKSNLSDAIRWVLGETSSRQLRGSGKMEDVIFGGTQRRGAMGFASVHLTLDNTDRRLDVDSDEVVMGNLDAVLSEPDVQIRLFGKPEVKGHRRMGVILARAESVEAALAKAERAYSKLEIEVKPRRK